MSIVKKPGGRNVAQESVQELLTREAWDEWAASMWEIATSGTKPERVKCPKCGVAVTVERTDLTSRINAGRELQSMGYGKPKDESESSKGFVLNRVVVGPGGA